MSQWDKSISNPKNKGVKYLVPNERVTHGNIMGWKSKTLDFGIVKEKSLNYGLFSYNGDKRIQQVRTSCNCIAQITVDDGRLISFQWKADEIPPHLNEMNVTKLLFVTFHDHSEDACEVRAKIIR